MRGALVLLMFVTIGAAPAAAVENKWKDTVVGGTWENGNNWSLNHEPLATEDVVIPANRGTITTNGAEKSVTSFKMEASAGANATVLTTADFDATVWIKVANGQTITIETGNTVRGKNGGNTLATYKGGWVRLRAEDGTINIKGKVYGGEGGTRNVGGLAVDGADGGKIEIFAKTVNVSTDGVVYSGKGGNGFRSLNGGAAGHGGVIEIEIATLLDNRGVIQGDKGGHGGDDGLRLDGGSAGLGGSVLIKGAGRCENHGRIEAGGGGNGGTGGNGGNVGVPDGGTITTGKIIAGDGGKNQNGDGGNKDGFNGGWIQRTVGGKARVITAKSKDRVVTGTGGLGQGQGANGSDGTLFNVTLKVDKDLVPPGAPLVALGDSVTGPAVRVGSYIVQSDTGSVDLVDLDATEITATGSVIINLCPTCPVNLTGNSIGAPIISAGDTICITGDVQTDPGVTLAHLTSPPVMPSPGTCLVPGLGVWSAWGAFGALMAAGSILVLRRTRPITSR
jgi:hypothetical protein